MTIVKRVTNEIRTQFSENLRYQIDKRGIKHSFISDSIGISRVHFQHVLNGKIFPTDELIRSIASILGLSPSDLFLTVNIPKNLADYLELSTEDLSK